MSNDLTYERERTSTPGMQSMNSADDDYSYQPPASGSSSATNGESSEAIRAEIERTRSQMSNKIDSLQNKLNPETIKAQAQDTLRSALEDGSAALMGYWRGNQYQIRRSVVDVVKRNPIPAALIGVGLGWALIDSFAHRNRASSGYGWSDDPNGGDQTYAQLNDTRYQAYDNNQYGNATQYSGVEQYAGSRGGYVETSHQPASTGESGWTGSSSGDAADQSLGEKVSHVVDQVKDSANQVMDKVTTKASELTQQAQQKTQQYSHKMQEQMSHMSTQNTREVVQSNPLAVGGVALALGALIGVLLPNTQRENELMGDLRNQMSNQAQALAGDVKQRVQQAVEEVKPDVQNLANKVVDDLAGAISGAQPELNREHMASNPGSSANVSNATSDMDEGEGSSQAHTNRKAKKQRDFTATSSTSKEKEG
jgi:ElaB/YqjD/DUF883 family membrane-anchored ribosome-binding protein